MQSAIEIKRPVDAVFGFLPRLERSIIATDPTVESVVKTTDGRTAWSWHHIPRSATGTWEPTVAGTGVTFRGDSRPVGAFKLIAFLMDRIG